MTCFYVCVYVCTAVLNVRKTPGQRPGRLSELQTGVHATRTVFSSCPTMPRGSLHEEVCWVVLADLESAHVAVDLQSWSEFQVESGQHVGALHQ